MLHKKYFLIGNRDQEKFTPFDCFDGHVVCATRFDYLTDIFLNCRVRVSLDLRKLTFLSNRLDCTVGLNCVFS